MTKQLIESNMNLVYFVISKYYPTFINDEDIVQTGMLALCMAANTWDENKSKFSTYAGRCIRNAINNELHNRNKHKNVLSLDYELSHSDGESYTLSDFCIGEEDVDFVDIDTFSNRLTDREYEIVNLKRKGKTANEIASIFGCSRKTVDAILRKLKPLWRSVNGD